MGFSFTWARRANAMTAAIIRIPSFMYSNPLCRLWPIIWLLFGAVAFAAAPTSDIKLDQVGYLNSAPKLAMVVSDTTAKDFTVRDARTASVAFRGKLEPAVDDP